MENVLDLTTKILVFIFVSLIEFRIFENKSISLADLVFLILFTLFFIKLNRRYFSILKSVDDKKHIVQTFIVFSTIWIVSYITPIFGFFESFEFFIENRFMIIGSIYLVTIAFVFYFISIRFGWRLIATAVFFAGLVNAILGFIGVFLYIYGIESQLVCIGCTSSPYMSGIPRVVGFSLTPNGYAYAQFSALMMAPTLLSYRSKGYILSAISVIALSLFMSFSKTSLLFLLAYFIFGILYFIQNSNYEKYRSILLYGSLFIGVCLYLSVTSILVIKKNSENLKCNYGDEIIFFETIIPNDVKLCPSFFVQRKFMYFKKGSESLPWGMGASNKISNKSKPHSTYFERYALHGFVGLLSLIFMVYFIAKLLFHMKNDRGSWDPTYIAFLLFWIMNLSIAFNGDILRFRELWVMLALTIGIVMSNTLPPQTAQHLKQN